MSELTPPVTERDHAEGPATARVTLVEYGDYECPMCGQTHVAIKQAQQAFGPNLRFVFRHFPLRSSHPHALEAAKAAEAAAAQGRFWQMHDRLFQHQTQLDSESLVAHARTSGSTWIAFGAISRHGKRNSGFARISRAAATAVSTARRAYSSTACAMTDRATGAR